MSSVHAHVSFFFGFSLPLRPEARQQKHGTEPLKSYFDDAGYDQSSYVLTAPDAAILTNQSHGFSQFSIDDYIHRKQTAGAVVDIAVGSVIDLNQPSFVVSVRAFPTIRLLRQIETGLNISPSGLLSHLHLPNKFRLRGLRSRQM
jgi:hypothetical protein